MHIAHRITIGFGGNSTLKIRNKHRLSANADNGAISLLITCLCELYDLYIKYIIIVWVKGNERIHT